MGTCFGDGNVFYKFETNENATGTHLQKPIFQALKRPQWSMHYVDGGGPKDSENTLNSFLTKCGEKVF